MPSKQTTTKPRRVVVTPRRRAVLEGLHTYKLLREATIHRLYFSAIKEARNVHDKLKRYRDQNLIGYIPMPIFRGADEGAHTFTHQHRRDTVYYLGRRGADLVGAPYDDRYEQMNFSHLYHRLDIQEFRIALELALQATPHTTLAHWINEHDHDENKKPLLYYKTGAVDPTTKKKLSLRPDAAFILHDEATDKEDFFFLEVDEGREDLSDRWKKKILAYRAYAATDFALDWQFNGKGFRVLTVNRSQTGKQQRVRKANLLTTAHQHGGRKQFWFATFDELLPDDQVTGAHILQDAIWQRAETADANECPPLRLADYLFGHDLKNK
jgi:hypothetical protein